MRTASPAHKRHRLFQFGILNPIRDLFGKWMPEGPRRPGALGVEVGPNRVFPFKELLTRSVGHSELNVRRLTTRTQTNDKTLRSVSRMPSGDFCRQRIDLARRI